VLLVEIRYADDADATDGPDANAAFLDAATWLGSGITWLAGTANRTFAPTASPPHSMAVVEGLVSLVTLPAVHVKRAIRLHTLSVHPAYIIFPYFIICG